VFWWKPTRRRGRRVAVAVAEDADVPIVLTVVTAQTFKVLVTATTASPPLNVHFLLLVVVFMRVRGVLREATDIRHPETSTILRKSSRRGFAVQIHALNGVFLFMGKTSGR
jgi:hypothetical protein